MDLPEMQCHCENCECENFIAYRHHHEWSDEEDFVCSYCVENCYLK